MVCHVFCYLQTGYDLVVFRAALLSLMQALKGPQLCCRPTL